MSALTFRELLGKAHAAGWGPEAGVFPRPFGLTWAVEQRRREHLQAAEWRVLSICEIVCADAGELLGEAPEYNGTSYRAELLEAVASLLAAGCEYAHVLRLVVGGYGPESLDVVLCLHRAVTVTRDQTAAFSALAAELADA